MTPDTDSRRVHVLCATVSIAKPCLAVTAQSALGQLPDEYIALLLLCNIPAIFLVLHSSTCDVTRIGHGSSQRPQPVCLAQAHARPNAGALNANITPDTQQSIDRRRILRSMGAGL